MDLSIIIVNWNSKEFLNKCLESVATHTTGLSFEVIVIDSGSFDGCAQMLREHHPHVRFIQSDTNIGFARANNAAFKTSIGENVLFLNPDTELLGPAIQPLLESLQALPKAGAVGAKLLNADGSIQSTSIQAFPSILSQFLNSEYLRRAYPRWSIWGMAPLFEPSQQPSKVEAISGACLMLKRQTFEEIGHFSEEYFMYAEDLDLCYKCQLAGYDNYLVPTATLIHYGGGSSEQVPSEFSAVTMRQSVALFLSKSRGPWYGLAYRASTTVLAVLRLTLLLALWPLRSSTSERAPHPRWSASVRKWRAILSWSLGIPAPPRRSDARQLQKL